MTNAQLELALASFIPVNDQQRATKAVLREGIDRLYAWIERLQLEDHVLCAYCGDCLTTDGFIPTAELLTQHAANCTSHPLWQRCRELEDLKAQVQSCDSGHQFLADWPEDDCPYCQLECLTEAVGDPV